MVLLAGGIAALTCVVAMGARHQEASAEYVATYRLGRYPEAEALKVRAFLWALGGRAAKNCIRPSHCLCKLQDGWDLVIFPAFSKIAKCAPRAGGRKPFCGRAGAVPPDSGIKPQWSYRRA